MTMKGLSTEALKAVAAGRRVVMAVWFDDRRTELQHFFDTNAVPSGEIADWQPDDDKRIWLADASKLMTYHTFFSAHPAGITVILDGHYPLTAPEDKLLEALSKVQAIQWPVPVGVSLDEPLIHHFAGDKLLVLLERLGLGPEERLEHAMITKSIERAREKLSETVRREITTHGEAEWYRLNAPVKYS